MTLLLLGAAPVFALNSYLNWDGNTWPGPEPIASSGSPANPAAVFTNVDGSGVDITFAWEAGVPFVNATATGATGPWLAPHDNLPGSIPTEWNNIPTTWANILGPGFIPGKNFLIWRQSTYSTKNNPQTLTISFSKPVSSFGFLLFDVDNNGLDNTNTPQHWIDRVAIAGNGGASPLYTIYSGNTATPSGNQTNNGNIVVAGNTLTATANSSLGNLNPGSINSTVLVDFGVQSLSSVTVDYDTLNVSTFSGQYIGFSAFRFTPTPVPEPSSLVLLAAGGLVALRRRRRQA